MTIPLSMALHMSYMARAATVADVRASISTPVLPSQETVAVIWTATWVYDDGDDAVGDGDGDGETAVEGEAET